MILQIEPVNFKLTPIRFSCFSDMVDKKRKVVDHFRNTSYEKKISKIDQEVSNGCFEV